ncbi:MAG TPA: glycosyltransferase family 39 protein [Blastocatellia bacterium]|nr:glycosyltransferase family 39 protein [Blastocatellia bacterium]
MATSEQEIETEKPRAHSLAAGLPFLLTLAAGAVCYGLFYRRGLGLAVIGYSVAPTERVLQGEVPYRDFLFNYTPGILWLNALLMKAFGVGLLTVRAGLLVTKLLTLALVYHLARRLTNARLALLPVALTLAWLGYEHIFNPYPDVYFMPLALAGLLCALRYDQSGRAGWLLLTGLMAGAVFLFKHNVGVFVMGCGFVALALREWAAGAHSSRGEFIGGLVKRAAIYLLGFAAVVAAMMAYLYSQHALGAMVEHFRHHAAAYSESRAIALPSVRQLWPLALALLIALIGAAVVAKRAPRLLAVFVMAVVLLMAALVLWPGRAFIFKQSATAAVAYLPPALFALVAAVALWPGKLPLRSRGERLTLRERLKAVWRSVANEFQSREARREWWRRNGATVTVMLFALGVYLEMFPRADYYHLVRVLPPVFLLLLVALMRARPVIAERLRRLNAPSSAAPLVVFAPLFLLVVIGWQATWRPQFDGRFRFVDRRELTAERGRGVLVGPQQAALVDGLVNLIQDNSAADEPIFSFSQRASALYFLAARRNPTRFLWWRSVGISKAERDAVMQMIAERQPKLVVVQEIAATEKTRDYIGQYYHRLGAVADLAVYGRD